MARARCLVTVALAACLSACGTQTQRTAKVVDCNVATVKILPSEASRRGSTTDWCARCKDKVYRCIGNADRDKTQCRPARDDDGCGN